MYHIYDKIILDYIYKISMIRLYIYIYRERERNVSLFECDFIVFIYFGYLSGYIWEGIKIIRLAIIFVGEVC